MFYSVLADLIVAVHCGYVAFVVLGQLLIWAGIGFRWKWVRNLKFRVIHLIAMLIVGLEAVFDIECPLTAWEAQLRNLAGQEASVGSFVGRCLHSAIFVNVDARILQGLHIGCALLVLATFIFFPPRMRRG
jgi:Protein of Unknown function (DUF2784)